MFNKRDNPQGTEADARERQSAAAVEARRSPRPDSGNRPGSAAVIGPSINVDGKLRGEEDLVIEGKVKGTIELKKNSVTIGSQGNVQADIYAHTIYVDGTMEGNLVASEQVVIRKPAQVRGSIVAPRVSLEDGARFNGSIDMDAESEVLSKAFSGKSPHSNTAGGRSSAPDKPSGGPQQPGKGPDPAPNKPAAQGIKH